MKIAVGLVISAFLVIAGCETSPPPDLDVFNADYSEKPERAILRCIQVARQTPPVTGGDPDGEFAEMEGFWLAQLEQAQPDTVVRDRILAKYAPDLTEERAAELIDSQNFILGLGFAAGRCDDERAEIEQSGAADG